MEHIFFNEEWNMEREYCSKHGIPKDKDGMCSKCLEEKNHKNGTNNRKLQGVRNSGKRTYKKNRDRSTIKA